MDSNKKPKRVNVPARLRARLQKEIKSKCPFCGDEHVEIFEVHHIDRDRSNSAILNLIMLCRTCHGKIKVGLITDEEVIGMKNLLLAGDKKNNILFEKIEIESEFPGGIGAWQRFLKENLKYPITAIRKRIEGTVVVKFVVDPNGCIKNVEAISGPVELRDEAIRVIKISGRWLPANQNGTHVKSYKKQPVVFRFEKNLIEKIPAFFKKQFEELLMR
jgi:TonB family protein